MPNFEPAESELFLNREVFALKRSAVAKLYTAFEALRLRLKDTSERLQISFPNEVSAISSKISQGENYGGCPWVMLDYLRYFNGQDMFAFRVMGWFGHYFSAHLVLGGQYAATYLSTISKRHFSQEMWFSTHPDPWKHEVEEPYCKRLDTLSEEEIVAHISHHSFIKLSIKMVTADLHVVEEEVVEFFGEMFLRRND